MKTLSTLKQYAGLSTIVLGLAAALSASCAAAQSAIKVNIPFAFQNGSQHLPSGQYLITMNLDHLMRVQGNKTGGFTSARPEDNNPNTASRVVFHKYGDLYFLREVWVSGKSTHQVCLRSKAEKQQQIAQVDAPRDGVEVALLESLR